MSSYSKGRKVRILLEGYYYSSKGRLLVGKRSNYSLKDNRLIAGSGNQRQDDCINCRLVESKGDKRKLVRVVELKGVEFSYGCTVSGVFGRLVAKNINNLSVNQAVSREIAAIV